MGFLNTVRITNIIGLQFKIWFKIKNVYTHSRRGITSFGCILYMLHLSTIVDSKRFLLDQLVAVTNTNVLEWPWSDLEASWTLLDASWSVLDAFGCFKATLRRPGRFKATLNVLMIDWMHLKRPWVSWWLIGRIWSILCISQ